VRELQNALHSYLTLGKLNLMGQITMAENEERSPGLAEIRPACDGLNASMAAIEKGLILKALEQARWHRGRAAAGLKLNYKTLQRKMKAYGINQSKFRT
jgi:DNA-binding NtrC family response regulator